jgi:hypothetical protein
MEARYGTAGPKLAAATGMMRFQACGWRAPLCATLLVAR